MITNNHFYHSDWSFPMIPGDSSLLLLGRHYEDLRSRASKIALWLSTAKAGKRRRGFPFRCIDLLAGTTESNSLLFAKANSNNGKPTATKVYLFFLYVYDGVFVYFMYCVYEHDSAWPCISTVSEHSEGWFGDAPSIGCGHQLEGKYKHTKWILGFALAVVPCAKLHHEQVMMTLIRLTRLMSSQLSSRLNWVQDSGVVHCHGTPTRMMALQLKMIGPMTPRPHTLT